MCFLVHVGASQGTVGHRSPVNVAYQSKAVLFFITFDLSDIEFHLPVSSVTFGLQTDWYINLITLSLLWAYTMSEGGRPTETSQMYQSFDEKQRTEGSTGDVGSS